MLSAGVFLKQMRFRAGYAVAFPSANVGGGEERREAEERRERRTGRKQKAKGTERKKVRNQVSRCAKLSVPAWNA